MYDYSNLTREELIALGDSAKLGMPTEQLRAIAIALINALFPDE